MADYQRDEFIDSEQESPQRSDEKLFQAIKIILSIILLIMALEVTIQIFYPINWIYVAFTLLLGSIILWTLCSFWLSKQKYPRIAQIILSITINSSLALIPLFVLLLCFKLDQIISPHAGVVMIPLFVWEVFILSFLIFIIPGLYDSESGSQKWVWVILIYYFAALLCEIAIIFQLSITIQFSWFLASGFILFALSFHLLLLLVSCKCSNIWASLILILLISSITLFTMMLDQSIEETERTKYFIMIPLLLICLIQTIRQII